MALYSAHQSRFVGCWSDFLRWYAPSGSVSEAGVWLTMWRQKCDTYKTSCPMEHPSELLKPITITHKNEILWHRQQNFTFLIHWHIAHTVKNNRYPMEWNGVNEGKEHVKDLKKRVKESFIGRNIDEISKVGEERNNKVRVIESHS